MIHSFGARCRCCTAAPQTETGGNVLFDSYLDTDVQSSPIEQCLGWWTCRILARGSRQLSAVRSSRFDPDSSCIRRSDLYPVYVFAECQSEYVETGSKISGRTVCLNPHRTFSDHRSGFPGRHSAPPSIITGLVPMPRVGGQEKTAVITKNDPCSAKRGATSTTPLYLFGKFTLFTEHFKL